MTDDIQNFVYVVPHTHWDREWYLPFEAFRMRLVKAIDRICENLESDPLDSFHMDGQTIVVEDYEEIRGPSDTLRRLIKEGRIQIGPWYVLPDEFLPSGESIIRNIQFGFRTSGKLGGPAKLGYLPDMFGHIGQMPQILKGFGIERAVTWRGVPKHIDKCGFVWKSPDDSEIFTALMPMGYSNGFNLDPDPEQIKGRIVITRAIMSRFIEGPSWLLMAGTDHQQPKKRLPAALQKAFENMNGWDAKVSTLMVYLEKLEKESKVLPCATGELRDPHYAPILPATASTRMYLKKRDFALSSLLERYAEPLAAWAWALGGVDQRDFIDYAWKLLLQNSPHDSICGCSVDEVHDEMETRYAKVETVLRRVLHESSVELGSMIKLPSGKWYALWTPAGKGGPIPVTIEIDGKLPKNAILTSPDGKSFPLQAVEILDPGATLGGATAPAIAAPMIMGFIFQEEEMLGGYMINADVSGNSEKATINVDIGAEPAGLNLDKARKKVEKAIARLNPKLIKVRIRKEPRTRAIAVIDGVKPFSLNSFKLSKSAGNFESPIITGEDFIENSRWRVKVNDNGTLTIKDLRNGKILNNALRYIDEGDRGDEYSFEPVENGEIIDMPEKVKVRVIQKGPVAAVMRIEAAYKIPIEFNRRKMDRSKRKSPLKINTDITLFDKVDTIDFRSEFENNAKDHRLRVLFEAPFEVNDFICESSFETVRRKANVYAKPRKQDPSDIMAALIGPEAEVGYGPHKGFSALEKDSYGLAVINKGLPEIEALKGVDGTALALTLVRSVGTISRDDMTLRSGHAGPDIPTPGGQCIGKQVCEFALYTYEGSWQSAGLPAIAHSWQHGPRLFPINPEGGKLAMTVAPISVDNPLIEIRALQADPEGSGALCARIYNTTDQTQAAQIKFHDCFKNYAEADLMGRPTRNSHIDMDTARTGRIELPPFRIMTVRLEPI